jgi:release factor glutamine methyltransferase
MAQEESAKTLRQALAAGVERLTATAVPTARRDAELLLMHAAHLDRAFLLANPKEHLAPGVLARYTEYLDRRSDSEPIQYILGEQEFYGLRFHVSPDVLIPRPETEHLVEALLARFPTDRMLQIADVGTGSGALAVALAHSLPQAKVVALDVSKAALRVASWNAEEHGVASRIRFVESDLFNSVPGELFDIVVSNPPYVAETDRHSLDAQVRDYEPHEALFAGPTGLEMYERLIPQAHDHLKPGGLLVLEIGAGQQKQLERLLKNWINLSFAADLQGIPRVALARRKKDQPNEVAVATS